MADEHHEPKPTQPTQPKGRDKDGKPYEPIEIPVPTEGDVMGLFEKVAHVPAAAGEKAPDGPSRNPPVAPSAARFLFFGFDERRMFAFAFFSLRLSYFGMFAFVSNLRSCGIAQNFMGALGFLFPGRRAALAAARDACR